MYPSRIMAKYLADDAVAAIQKMFTGFTAKAVPTRAGSDLYRVWCDSQYVAEIGVNLYLKGRVDGMDLLRKAEGSAA